MVTWLQSGGKIWIRRKKTFYFVDIKTADNENVTDDTQQAISASTGEISRSF